MKLVAVAAVVLVAAGCDVAPADDRKVCDAVIESPQTGFALVDMDGDGWFTACFGPGYLEGLSS